MVCCTCFLLFLTFPFHIISTFPLTFLSRFILFVHLYRLLNDNEAEPLKYVIQQSLDIDDGRPSESLSAYPESSSYRSSDDLSKVTMPSFDYRSERMISNPSTLHS